VTFNTWSDFTGPDTTLCRGRARPTNNYRCQHNGSSQHLSYLRKATLFVVATSTVLRKGHVVAFKEASQLHKYYESFSLVAIVPNYPKGYACPASNNGVFCCETLGRSRQWIRRKLRLFFYRQVISGVFRGESLGHCFGIKLNSVQVHDAWQLNRSYFGNNFRDPECRWIYLNTLTARKLSAMDRHIVANSERQWT